MKIYNKNGIDNCWYCCQEQGYASNLEHGNEPIIYYRNNNYIVGICKKCCSKVRGWNKISKEEALLLLVLET